MCGISPIPEQPVQRSIQSIHYLQIDTISVIPEEAEEQDQEPAPYDNKYGITPVNYPAFLGRKIPYQIDQIQTLLNF